MFFAFRSSIHNRSLERSIRLQDRQERYTISGFSRFATEQVLLRFTSLSFSLFPSGLTHHVVHTLKSLMSYVEEGTKARKTASTLQNPSSSRSHALLTVDLSQETSESGPASSDASSPRRRDTNPRNPGGSRLHLVDLAGSESAATCGGVHRLKVSHPLKIISSGRRISRDEDRYFSRTANGWTGGRSPRRIINLPVAAIARQRIRVALSRKSLQTRRTC